MKKILYIITKLKDNNGPNRVLENMLTGIDSKKYKLYVLSLFENREAIKKRSDVEYLSLGFKNVFSLFINGRKSIKKIEEEIKPDITHSHGIFPDYLNLFFSNSKRINTLHCNIFKDYRYSYNFIKASLMIKFHLNSLKKLDNVVCCSESVYNGMKRIKCASLMYVENGTKDVKIDTKDDVRKKMHIKDGEMVYVYVGNLSKRKNALSLINLFLKYSDKNEHLLLLGDGKLKNKIESVSNKNNNNIHVLGYKKNVNKYLSASDVYISASLAEGLPISVIDALNSGLLLLLSDIGPHKEFFDKDNTYLGECFNENNFKNKLDIIRRKVGTVNRQSIARYKNRFFSDKKMMEGYEALYENQ